MAAYLIPILIAFASSLVARLLLFLNGVCRHELECRCNKLPKLFLNGVCRHELDCFCMKLCIFFLNGVCRHEQRLFANTAYFTGLLLLYFLILQMLSNAMYGSMAQLAIICLFQFCFLALVLALGTMFCQNRGISPVSSITNNFSVHE